MNDLLHYHSDLADRSRLGSPMLFAGSLYWLFVALCTTFLPETAFPWIYLYSLAFVLPLGVLLAKFLHVDLYPKNNPFTMLIGIISGIQLFFIPVIIYFALVQPMQLLFAIGVMYGAHFFPYMWVYQTHLYTIFSVTIVAISTIFLLAPLSLHFYLPLSLFIVYTLFGIFAHTQSKRLQRSGAK
ncbi:hypothetical protein [Geomicrobium sp. JCM 19038]|uniref:DUF7010 family protein n=1 Tax=Geomicrobium sp. JCM 19038 TaxID=1460635 RepID=UPI00045F3D0F|nr:hypothetical protein [Geomicrobium sp. JCM 19038]EZH64583.1 hypothetical protein DH09_18810 [Bacillaceae bacterium JMAK1]GAK08818.1 hypothetical protein JCM19038_2614 [Geomicrobium sp. JCM 19038]